MFQLDHILVATDFSEPADTALTYGRALAAKFGATLHVLNVVDDLFARSVGLEGYAGLDPELQREIEAAAAKQLRSLVASEAIPVKPVTRTSNAPAQAIVDYALRSKIDLIVIGTRGRGGVAHLLMGSVAERVVRTASCPVLTVHQKEREFVSVDSRSAADDTRAARV
jgi:nucleotide-binding universal stress UspA family protein